MNNLSQYIQKQRDAGAVDSVGSFTLAIDKARDKLAQFALAKPQDSVLKVVQAANRLAVSSLHVQLQRNTVLIYFELDAKNHCLSASNLSQSLLTPLDNTNPARSHLALALCTMAGIEPEELMWGDWCGKETATILSLGYGRAEVFHNVPFPRTEPLEGGRRFHLLFMKKRSYRIPKNQTGGEFTALTNRCAFSFVPVHLNGKPLEPKLPVYELISDPAWQLTSPYLAGLKILQEEKANLRWSAPATRSRQTTANSLLIDLAPKIQPVFRLESPSDWLFPLTQPVKFSRLFGVPAYLYGPSCIYYVKDGVLMNPIDSHDAGGGAFSVLDGTRLKTDITGLQIVEDESVALDRENSVQIWIELVNDFLANGPPIYGGKSLVLADTILLSLKRHKALRKGVQSLTELYHYVFQRERKKAMQLKRFHRQLETRRGYLAYFRDAKKATTFKDSLP